MKNVPWSKKIPFVLRKKKFLAVLSNAKMNERLKEIADRCEINKKMTFHTEQHTFAGSIRPGRSTGVYTESR
jgi:hypothetical protein